MAEYLDKAGVDYLWKKIKKRTTDAKNAAIAEAIKKLTGDGGTSVSDAKNVSETIKGKDITEIFEPSMPGGGISSRVKEATKAIQDGDGNIIKITYQKVLTFDDKPTKNSDNPVKSSGIYTEIENVRNLAAGKTKGIVIDSSDTSAGYENHSFNIKKSEASDVIKIHSTKASDVFKFKHADGTEYYVSRTGLSLLGSEDPKRLKVGDLIYTTPKNIKDWWYAGFARSPIQTDPNNIVGDFVFNVLDADTPDLSGYATKDELSQLNDMAITNVMAFADTHILKFLRDRTGNTNAASTDIQLGGAAFNDTFAGTGENFNEANGKPTNKLVSGAQVAAFISANIKALSNAEIDEATGTSSDYKED